MYKKYLPLALILSVLSGCGGGIGTQDPDPVIQDFPVAYVKRTLPENDDGELLEDDVRDPLEFRPGARLYIRNQASPSSPERHITANVFPAAEFANEEGQVLFDIRDLAPSFDGTRLLFAMRAPEIENADENDQPTWNIWEYDLESRSLRRIIESDNTAEEGDDVAPQYLADGRIVFTSTRQRQSKAILLDEGKPQYEVLNEANNEPALNLHVMAADGTDIEQTTFNQSSDLDPIVLQNGKVLFTRWNRSPGNDGMDLYQLNPDGTELEILYGHHSHDVGSDDTAVHFVRPVELEDGRIMVSLRPYQTIGFGGDIVAVDIDGFTDHEQPVYYNLGATGEGQKSLTSSDILTGEGINLSGRYAFASPMLDGTGRLLVGWSQCRLVDAVIDTDDPVIYPCTQDRIDSGNYDAAPPLYGLWVLNPQSGTQLPIVQPQEGVMYTDAVIFQNLGLPNYIPDGIAGFDVDEELASEGYGVIHIRSVYDFDGVDTTPAGLAVMSNPTQTKSTMRTAQFLRVEKPVSKADDDVVEVDGFAFGRAGALRMREILGYVPIEPDGSVKFKVPANVAFSISVLDGDGKRLSESEFPRHSTWLQVKPGEVMECIGCHTADSEMPHGRYDAQAPSINSGAPTNGIFPGTDDRWVAKMGETMAETYARLNDPLGLRVRTLSSDIEFVDDWAEADDKEASYSLAYSNLPENLISNDPDEDDITPMSQNCKETWTGICRIVINYETKINPLWSLTRTNLAMEDRTCTSCHTDEGGGAAKVPDGQLDLTAGVSDMEPEQLKSYRELLFTDALQTLDDSGSLVDELVPVLDDEWMPVFETDANGNEILDSDGNPIPLMESVDLAPALVAGSAASSTNFFDRFKDTGDSNHFGILSTAELKLIAEWADIGAQYYNNPFDIPQD